MTPPRSASPVPSEALNSQSARRSDALTSHSTIQERPKFVHFQENCVGSFERDANQEDSPVVEVTASEFRAPRATFLVNPGSDVNLVKLRALRQDMIVEFLNSILVTSITNDPVKTIGAVKITILKSPVEFRVVGNELPISLDEILGRPCLREEQVQIAFRHNTLVTVFNPITPIPFVDVESQEANKSLKSGNKPFARILKIKARTTQPIAIDVSNSEIHQGYLPRIDTPEGLYIGEASVTAQDGNGSRPGHKHHRTGHRI